MRHQITYFNATNLSGSRSSDIMDSKWNTILREKNRYLYNPSFISSCVLSPYIPHLKVKHRPPILPLPPLVGLPMYVSSNDAISSNDAK